MFALLMPVAIAFAPGRAPKLHGEARWAKTREVRAAGLFDNDKKGIVIGKTGFINPKFLTFNGTEQGKNVICAAPPGSGKTQGLMLPNCLSWRDSLVALDVKADCYDRSAGFRAKNGQAVYQLNFLSRDYRTHQYNPFAYVSKDKNFRVGDIEKIATYLCPNPPPPGDTFWASNARDMFRAIALFLLDSGQDCTLGALLDIVETPEELQNFAKRILKELADKKLPYTLEPQTVRDLAKIAQRPERTHGGIKDQLTAALAPLKNPLVRFATNANTFDLRRLRFDPMSIYVTVMRPDIPVLRSILNLFFQQLVDLNMDVEYGKDPGHKYEILLALDEFAQMGRLDAVFEGVTFFRSFGIRLMALLQSPSQNRTTYSVEGAKTFEQAFDCSVFFTPAARDLETADLISRLLGDQTVRASSESKRKGFDTKQDSTSTSDQKRELWKPQEVRRMSLRKQIVIISGLYPIYCEKIKTWKEPTLAWRIGETPLPPKMDIEAMASKPLEIQQIVEIVTRPIEAADMADLGDLTLDDFSCDFSSIEVPAGQMSEDEVAKLRDRFLDTLAAAA
jgi:type IV secretion system protein VirD4